MAVVSGVVEVMHVPTKAHVVALDLGNKVQAGATLTGADGSYSLELAAGTYLLQVLLPNIGIWETNKPIAQGTLVSPTSDNGLVYECVRAGTTGASEPLQGGIPGEIIDDGSALWLSRRYLLPYNKRITIED